MGSSSAATATHKRSHAQLCAVFGDAPLQKIVDVGWYFRLRILSVNTGWVGGFGIGITLSTPSALATLPERASRVQHSWLAGYWGRTYSNGVERLIEWKPQDLCQNDEVGFLVTTEGECVVYINDVERCRFGDPPVPVKPSLCPDGEPELTALIDVTPTTAACVEFLNDAQPPASASAGTPQPSAAAGLPSNDCSATSQADGPQATRGSRDPTPPGAPPPSAVPVASPVTETSPPPPPPSPRAASPPQRFGPPANVNPPRLGGSAPPPVPPLPPLPQGLTPPASVAAPAGTAAPADNRDGSNSRAAAATAAARRVPQLALPVR